MDTVTHAYALTEAARILHWAEGETDLAKMERLTELADTWVAIAAVLTPDDLDA